MTEIDAPQPRIPANKVARRYLLLIAGIHLTYLLVLLAQVPDAPAGLKWSVGVSFAVWLLLLLLSRKQPATAFAVGALLVVGLAGFGITCLRWTGSMWDRMDFARRVGSGVLLALATPLILGCSKSCEDTGRLRLARWIAGPGLVALWIVAGLVILAAVIDFP